MFSPNPLQRRLVMSAIMICYCCLISMARGKREVETAQESLTYCHNVHPGLSDVVEDLATCVGSDAVSVGH